MKKDIKELQYDLLLETVQHYNSSNRCESSKGSCSYTPENLRFKVGKSEGCAIGRKLRKKKALEFDAIVSASSISGSISNTKLFNKLPLSLKRLGEPFLSRLQSLHDTTTFWDKNGLNNHGRLSVNNIINNFGLKSIDYEATKIKSK